MRAALFFCLVLSNALFASQRILVGIAGGTGSGKTTIAKNIQRVCSEASTLISQDSYYRDLSELSLEERAKVNFDHPNAVDFTTLRKHLLALKEGRAIDKPIYNFHSHTREVYTERVEPENLILVEGILLFAMEEIRDLFDLKVFVDTDDDIRLLRRIDRDIRERSRDLQSVLTQYEETVKPMHDAFVAPSKQFADVIIPRGGHNQVALDMILAKLDRDLSNFVLVSRN